MSRAILLPTGADPFLLSLWTRLYEKYIQDKDIVLYVYICKATTEELTRQCSSLFSNIKNVKIFTNPLTMDHGKVIKFLLEQCIEDNVCLIEDDLFLLKSGEIEKCFKDIELEKASVIGSSRGSCSPELSTAIANKFHLYKARSPEHYLSEAPNFWPCLLFAKKELLLKTDLDFSAKFWPKNTYIKELDWTTIVDCYSDTFVWASIQLRFLSSTYSNIQYVHQHHAGAVDIKDSQIGSGIFKPETPWVHFGSLSTGYCGSNLLLFDNYPLSEIGMSSLEKKTYISLDRATLENEIARRFGLWLFLSSFFHVEIGADYRYAAALEQSINHYQIKSQSYEFEQVYSKLLRKHL